MVYCGKASLNCKNCRVRRIKCNRLEPECSQCVRAGKKCPGYRDQLTLMFRDETVKLKKKFEGDPFRSRAASSSAAAARAAKALSSVWTPEASPTTPTTVGSGGSSSSSSSIAPPEVPKDGWQQKQQQEAMATAAAVATASALVPAPSPLPADHGLQFYLDNYLFGHPDSPSQNGTGPDVALVAPWIFHPAARTAAEAVGMEGLANLTGDRQLKMAAWQGYVTGLRQTALSLAHASSRDVYNDMRSIVMLAMFEIVRGTEPFDTANVHIMGAAVLMSKFFPRLPSSPQPFRGLMQICYALLITYHASGMPMPPVVASFASGMRVQCEDDQRMAELLVIMIDGVNTCAYVHRHLLVDGRSNAVSVVTHLLQLDARLGAWEASVEGRSIWQIQTCHTATLPPEACYRGSFHRYSDLQTARVWSYYRWLRILLNQVLLEIIDRCPQATAQSLKQAGGAAVHVQGLQVLQDPTPPPGSASEAAAPAVEDGAEKKDNAAANTIPDSSATAGPDLTVVDLRCRALRVIRTCVENILISVPTHWRHPGVPAEDHAEIASPSAAYGTNNGAVAVFPVLFHLKVAACAPGTPVEDWQWALGVMDTAWGHLGLEQARFLGRQMRSHRAALDRQGQQGRIDGVSAISLPPLLLGGANDTATETA